MGITRAEKNLFLTNAQMRTLFGRTSMNPASRFIAEIPEELLEDMQQAKRAETSFAAKTRPFGSPFGAPGKSSGGSFGSPASRKPVSRPAAQPSGGDTVGWKVGDKAEHGKWGIGTVVSVKGEGEGTELDIAFPSPTGIKRLLAKFAPIKKA